MTENPSAEALELGRRHGADEITAYEMAVEIDALIAQRVSAERERCAQIALQYRDEVDAGEHAGLGDPERALGQGYAANLIGKRIRAPAERPAPEGPHPIRPTDSAVLHASLNALGPSHDGAVERDLAASTGERPARWGELRLLSGDLASDEEMVDAELDLDDFQFWFQENPKHTGFKQILINLSGEQWGKLKELPLVEERSPPVFLGHMLAFDHGIHNDTPAGAAHERALAREIFGECWAIGKCTCLWVTAIQTVIGLIRGQPADPLAPRRHVFDLWHVYGAVTATPVGKGDPNVK